MNRWIRTAAVLVVASMTVTVPLTQANAAGAKGGNCTHHYLSGGNPDCPADSPIEQAHMRRWADIEAHGASVRTRYAAKVKRRTARIRQTCAPQKECRTKLRKLRDTAFRTRDRNRQALDKALFKERDNQLAILAALEADMHARLLGPWNAHAAELSRLDAIRQAVWATTNTQQQDCWDREAAALAAGDTDTYVYLIQNCDLGLTAARKDADAAYEAAATQSTVVYDRAIAAIGAWYVSQAGPDGYFRQPEQP